MNINMMTKRRIRRWTVTLVLNITIIMTIIRMAEEAKSVCLLFRKPFTLAKLMSLCSECPWLPFPHRTCDKKRYSRSFCFETRLRIALTSAPVNQKKCMQYCSMHSVMSSDGKGAMQIPSTQIHLLAHAFSLQVSFKQPTCDCLFLISDLSSWRGISLVLVESFLSPLLPVWKMARKW